MRRFFVRLLKTILFFIFILSSFAAHTQNKTIDSLSFLISKAASDTQRINLIVQKVIALSNFNIDSAIILGKKNIEEATAINYKKGEVNTRVSIAFAYCFKGEYPAAEENLNISRQILSTLTDSAALGKMYDGYGVMYSMQNKYDTALPFYEKAITIAGLNNNLSLLRTACTNMAIAYQQQSQYPKALEYYQKALKAAEKEKDEEGEAYILLNMAITFTIINDSSRAEQLFLKSIDLAKKLELKIVEAYAYSNLSSLYSDMGKFKEQYDFGMKAVTLAKEIGDAGIEASSLSRAATALAYQDRFQDAEKLNRQAMSIADSSMQPLNIYQAYANMGKIFKMENKLSEAIPYYEKAFRSLSDADLYDLQVADSYKSLSECYEQTKNYDKALTAYKTFARINDSITNKENIRKATELTLNYEFEKKQQAAKAEQVKKDAEAKRVKNIQYFTIAALGIIVLAVIVIAFIQYKNSKQKQKANLLLHRQKEKVESTLSELKATQTQLIQSEKMASLGELTAGIAHEIQNPLNFVNNFSEVNSELIEELRGERRKAKDERNEVAEDEILNDVQQNLEKILHHGKRADAIVKGMLQHTRASAGKKEPTNINALTDEYLRLSYHGMRAKDKLFYATLKTDFDTTIGKINIVPPDIGRVLLNLFNNAFYSLGERRKAEGVGYEPTISVFTKHLSSTSAGAGIEIHVKDNGIGIPQKVVDKIFQPFFTTKPTGQGTGLGLSLSYDIIKAHGGDIRVENKEGEGAEFIISLL